MRDELRDCVRTIFLLYFQFCRVLCIMSPVVCFPPIYRNKHEWYSKHRQNTHLHFFPSSRQNIHLHFFPSSFNLGSLQIKSWYRIAIHHPQKSTLQTDKLMGYKIFLFWKKWKCHHTVQTQEIFLTREVSNKIVASTWSPIIGLFTSWMNKTVCQVLNMSRNEW